MRSDSFFSGGVLAATFAIAIAGCSSTDSEQGISPDPTSQEAGNEESGQDDATAEASADVALAQDGAADGSVADAASSDAAALDWRVIRDPGDPKGDCQAKDPTCSADFEQVYFAIEGGTIHFDVRHHAPYPATDGSWEIMMFPKDPMIVGHSLQFVAGKATWWTADCSSGASFGLRHAGCHWLADTEPAELHYEWVAADRFLMHMPLADLLPAGVTELLVGVGGAPFAVQKTAEYTDRYPDEMLVTSSEVKGLQSIILPTGP